MNAVELRIGNFYQTGIEVKGSREAKLNLMENRVIELTLNYFKVLSMEPSLLPFVNPIPLTEEWLIKFGFKEHGGKDCWRIYDFILTCFKNKLRLGYFGESLESMGNEIQYVHQLQNLYFALTGQELSLK